MKDQEQQILSISDIDLKAHHERLNVQENPTPFEAQDQY